MKCRMDVDQLAILEEYIEARIMIALRLHNGTLTPVDKVRLDQKSKAFKESFIHEGYESDGGKGKSTNWERKIGDPEIHKIDEVPTNA